METEQEHTPFPPNTCMVAFKVEEFCDEDANAEMNI